MKKKAFLALTLTVGAALILAAAFFLAFRRPYRNTVEESGVSPALVYAVMKAESGFEENAVSSAGAVGLMQIMPSTAEFICRLKGIEFDETRLNEGEYNTNIGCAYLAYLLERFPVTETAIAAYNAGEGTVAQWLNDSAYSADGRSLTKIPYPETAAYVKKVENFRKFYRFFYR